MYSYESQKRMEEAIGFLVNSIGKTGKNPKPVILHSLRVALYLYQQDYNEKVIIGAVLHDLVEDTRVTVEYIRGKFGDEVARLVEANTFNESIQDKTEQYTEMFNRCLDCGKDALVVRAADILDNSDYYDGDKELMEKIRYFIDMSEGALKDEKVWQDLDTRYKS